VAPPLLRLKFERIARNLSQNDLANQTGLKQSDISSIERRRLNPTPMELAKLANALLVNPPDVLMTEVELKTPESAAEKVGV
jgi:transcriptional regulator with XRE-family HTH domain